MTTPASNLADGNVKIAFVLAIADPAQPTVTELTAGTVVDLSCYLTADGYTPGLDEQVITDDRLCSTASFEKPGRYTETLSIAYVYRQQDEATPDNAAFHTLKHRVTGFIVARWGADYDDAFATGDVVDVIPVQMGQQSKQPPEANSVLRVNQRLFITSTVHRDVAVAA